MGKKVNRKYKDTIFRMLFGDKRELLALYNAIHGTDYTDPEALEIVTLKNAIYMGMKNDIAYVLDMRLSLVEHQSTVNYNMPLRMLLYIGDLYKKLFRKRNLYARKRISLPMPEFFVFYNGVEDQPERLTMRLSDAYTHAGADVNLELVVVQLNINPGYNEELKKKCPALTGYAYFVSRVREYRERMELEEAIELAVDDCIEHDILKEFMLKNSEEVKKMGISIYHYDREEHMRIMEEEAREDGMEQGLKKGREQGLKQGLEQGRLLEIIDLVDKKRKKGQTPEFIADFLEEDVSYIQTIYDLIEGEGKDFQKKSVLEKLKNLTTVG